VPRTGAGRALLPLFRVGQVDPVRQRQRRTRSAEMETCGRGEGRPHACRRPSDQL